ncbi:hypothetical protein PS6_005468 [Mucor atramentarius]
MFEELKSQNSAMANGRRTLLGASSSSSAPPAPASSAASFAAVALSSVEDKLNFYNSKCISEVMDF